VTFCARLGQKKKLEKGEHPENQMKTILGLIVSMAVMSCLAAEKSELLDKQAVGLLVAQSEVVIHCHLETNEVGQMDPAMAARYGVVLDNESRFLATVKETLVGPAINQKQIIFSCHPVNGKRRSVTEGDYVLFVRRDAQKRWFLANDLQGIQPFTEDLRRLVKEAYGKP
jgi:hypothetical protein